jgi:hypothetical protein
MNALSTLLGRLTLAGAALAVLAGCGSSNRLSRYDFTGARVAVVAAIPPRPAVFTDLPADAWVNPHDPVGTLIRAGTAAAKHREAREAQARMDSALALVDVPEAIAARALLQSARYLGYQPSNVPGTADYLLDLRVADYGLVADSWEATVHFTVDAEMILVDRHTRRPIWKERIREYEPVSRATLGLGTTFGNVFTAAALSRLSVEEMTAALEHLAAYAADRLTLALRDDYYESRSAARASASARY